MVKMITEVRVNDRFIKTLIQRSQLKIRKVRTDSTSKIPYSKFTLKSDYIPIYCHDTHQHTNNRIETHLPISKAHKHGSNSGSTNPKHKKHRSQKLSTRLTQYLDQIKITLKKKYESMNYTVLLDIFQSA